MSAAARYSVFQTVDEFGAARFWVTDGRTGDAADTEIYDTREQAAAAAWAWNNPDLTGAGERGFGLPRDEDLS